MASKSNFMVAVDIGTSKIVALAGMKNGDGNMELLGAAKVEAKGIKRGMVFNIDEIATSVKSVIDKLRTQVDGKIEKVDIAYAGQPMKIFDHKGYRFTSGDGVVTLSDINELFNEAKNLKVERDYKILHIIPQKFIIDEEIVEVNPVGITGRKLEVSYKLITVPEIHFANLQRVFEKVGVEMGEVVFSPIASGEAVLTEDEKEIGTILLDIGAGTTKVAVYKNGVLIHTAVVPFGGDVITKDIKEGCSILPKWAEQLKVQYGEALGDFADEHKIVTIPGHSGWEPKEISFKSLAFIIQARLEEIIDCVYFQIERSGIIEDLGSGIVIVGGTAELHNLISLVKFRTGMDVRKAFLVIRAKSSSKEFLYPDYYSCLGLLKTGIEKANPSERRKKKKVKKRKEGGFSPWLKGVVQGVLDYVDDDDIAMN